MRMYELVNVCVCVSLKPTIFELRVDLLNFKSKLTKISLNHLRPRLEDQSWILMLEKNVVIFLGPLTNGFFWLVLWLSRKGQRREQRGRRKPASAQPRPKFIDRQLAFVSCVFTNFFFLLSQIYNLYFYSTIFLVKLSCYIVWLAWTCRDLTRFFEIIFFSFVKFIFLLCFDIL